MALRLYIVFCEITDIDKRLDQSVSPAWMRFFFFNVKESSTCLWVDPDTKLPIHLHGDFLLDKCLFSDFEAMRLVEINDQWEWGVPVEQTFFPERPQGYEAMVVPGRAY